MNSNWLIELLEKRSRNRSRREEKKKIEKEKEVCCLRLSIFKKYWNILKRNYQDKTHNDEDLKMYFSILRDYQEQDVINAIKEVLKKQPYFPRVDEIVKYLPTQQEQEEPGWFYQNLENNLPTKEEQEEMQNILDELMEEWYGYKRFNKLLSRVRR